MRSPFSEMDGVLEEDDLGRRVVVQDVQDVHREYPLDAVAALVGEGLAEPLAADLEVVAAAPAVLEVTERAERPGSGSGC